MSGQPRRLRVLVAALLAGAALVTWMVTRSDEPGGQATADLNRMQQSKPPMTTAPTP